MNPIELEIRRPKADDPRYTERAGTRGAEEVFQELKQRLDSMGMLPDEYFLLDRDWQDGRRIPEGADVFVTTDYGESEGVYLDGYLKWYEDSKSVTKSFFTGKTLGETGADLDRMFLIASEITKAFHGERGCHERYMRLGEREKRGDKIVCLTPKEQKLFIDALIDRREKLVGEMDGTEQLLRRMVGNITQYMDEVGERPLRISSFDKTMLAIRDGELEAFKKLLPKVIDHADELLIETAGRAGTVGRKMTICLLNEVKAFSNIAYLTASRRAVAVGDTERVQFLMEQYEIHAAEPRAEYYGEVIAHAIGENRQMARTLLEQSPACRIEASSPELLYCASIHPSENFQLMDELVKKGAPCGDRAWEILNALTSGGNTWIAEILLRDGMKVAADDCGAFDVCVKNGATECAKKLLEQGTDFERYTEWAVGRPYSATDEKALAELKAYCQSIHSQEQTAAGTPTQEMALGGLSQ